MAGNSQVFQEAMNQGHSAAWDQSWNQAAGFYRQALEEFPAHPQALVSLGLALIELQLFEEALKCYMKAARLSPQDPLPMEKIAQLYERLGNLERASQAALHSAELYLKNRDIKKAVENWERVTRLQPQELRAHSRLATIYGRIGEKDRAVREYLAVASLQQSAGETGKAAASVDHALQVVPASAEALQARLLLRESRALPKPERRSGGTAPLRMSQVRQLQEPKDQLQGEVSIDPVEGACQKALMALAGLLFETADTEQEEQTGRLTLKKIVSGTGGLRKPVDRTRMLLHLSQVIDLQARGEFAQAAEELQRAMDVGLEHPAAAFDLGYLYAHIGRLESAARFLQQAVNHPDFALGARLILGDIFRQKGQMKEASIEYLEALKLADILTVPPHQTENLRKLYEPLVEAYRLESDAKAQPRLVENVHDLLMRPDWQEQIQRARGQLSGAAGAGMARPLAEVLTEAGSSQLVSALSRVRQMKDGRRLRSAMEEVFYALEIAPTYLPLHTLMAELLVDLGEIQQAVAKYLVVGRVYSMRGEPTQATAMYRRLIELAPADLNVRMRLIEELLSSGQVDEAAGEYLQLAEVYMSLADLPMARKTYTDALRNAQLSKISHKTRLKILIRIADIDMQSLDWRQAVRVYEQIRTLQPENEESRLRLVDLYFRLGQDLEASRELLEYMDFLESYGRQDQELPFLEELLKDHPDRLPIRRQLADLYRRQGRAEEAIAQFDSIGEMMLNAGNREGAIDSVQMILALNPPNKADYQLLLEQLRLGKV